MPKKSTLQDPGDAIRANSRRELSWHVDQPQDRVALHPISPPKALPPFQPITRPRPRPATQEMPPPPAAQPPQTAPAPVADTSSHSIAPPRPRPQKRRRGRGWSISLLLFVGMGITGGVGVLSLIWLTTLPPAADCGRVSQLSSDAEQLYCARAAAQSGDVEDLKNAVEQVQGWSEQHLLYAEAQLWLGRWSQSLLDMAQQRYANSDLKGALEVAGYIPETSPLYAEAQGAIALWQEEWQRGEAVLATAQAALQQQDWDTASAQLLVLGQLEAPYWREQQVAVLTEQILAERTAWTALQEARKQVGRDDAQSLEGAIAQLQSINPQTQVWQSAMAELQGWGETLAELGLTRWREGDTLGALEIAQAIPPKLPLTGEAQYLVRLGHAQHLAAADVTLDWQPSVGQIWRLQEAIAALQQIPTTSAFYAPAQANLDQWQQQLVDLGQLQWASAIASVGSRSALETAQYQASQLGLERPRRLQAQTLLAHWGQQIERLRDMPLFNRAQGIAAAADIPALQRAIALAERVPAERALFADAQGAIATWVAQIQTIEDQPILDQAQTYAREGDLQQAIREARRIQPGRALTAEAQQLAQTWQADIDRVLIAEDRRILDQATTLAASGSLSQAIDTAAQVGRDRPLSGEARAAINQWEAERAAIWQQWEAEAQEPVYEEPTYSNDPVYSDPGADASAADTYPADY